MTKQPDQKNSEQLSSYKLTSEQLDNATITVITTLLSGFIVVQNFLQNSGEWCRYAAVFAVVTLFFHYFSFITAHFAQIYKAKNKEQLCDYFSQWTIRINCFVYILVAAEFVVSILLILYGN